MHPQRAQRCIFEELKLHSVEPSNIFGTGGMSGLPAQYKGQLTRLTAALHHRTSSGDLECAPLCPPHSSAHTYSFFHFQSKKYFQKHNVRKETLPLVLI